MPKKSATARGGAQRNKPKVQKSIELVRQPKTTPAESDAESTAASVSTATATPVSTVETPTIRTTPASKATTTTKAARRPKTESTESANGSGTDSKAESTESVASPAPAPKGSASERLAARRQAVQKQRTSVTLISAENYSYVRKDLIFIAILAAIMFSAIIILHFVPAIGG